MRNAIIRSFVGCAVIFSLVEAVRSQIPITDIQVFQQIRNLNNRGDEHLAIDDDPSTVSFLTPAFTDSPHTVALGLGGLVDVNRFRADKSGDTDGTDAGAAGFEPIDNMDLQLLFTTDEGPLESRTYQPVSGLTNGYNGTQLINADDVDAETGRVDNDHHDSFVDGIYSLTFDTVQATALGLSFARDAADGAPWTHYFAWELDPMLDDVELPVSDIQVFATPDVGRPLNTRNDATNSIDGDSATWSFLTPAGTTEPQIAGFGLSESTAINRLRVDKWGDTDAAGDGSGAPGIAPIDNMDLQLLFTTDLGPLNARSYQPVTGLISGYEGREQIAADGIDPANATVNNDHHDTLEDGIYSLSFDTVEATGFGLRFERDAADSAPFTHYRVWEVELMQDTAVREIAEVQVFGAELPSDVRVELNNRGDQQLAVDGDLGTVSFLTPSSTDQINVAALDLGGLRLIDRLRVAKNGDIDGLNAGAPGLEPIDNMDLEILITKDDGPLELREYIPVSGLTNGFDGTELIEADEVLADGTVDNDHHDFELDGWYSLSFDTVGATALAIRFARDEGDGAPFVHYSAYEIEVYEAASIPCDPNGDGICDANDIDAMTQRVLDGNATAADRQALIESPQPEGLLTYAGDSDMNGEFNDRDLVTVFIEGKYLTGERATWVQGDWDGDFLFNDSDFVKAFIDGGYLQGPRGATSAVPEPTSLVLFGVGLFVLIRQQRADS